jgi:WS/DGAT/MGAT family acyltransferase
MSVERARKSRFARLTSLDRMFLHLESRDWPGHFGGLAVVEGKALLDGSGQLRLQEIRERVNRRLAHVPQLRRRLHFPGPLGGNVLWVDDHLFDIQHHVHETAVEAPGGALQLLEAAARLYGQLLNRRRPLWELWFLTGMSDGRVGVLLKLHHSVADGMAAVAIMGSLFDLQPDAPDPVTDRWAPEPVPGEWSLVADNLSNKIRIVGLAATMLVHPLRLVRGARVRIRVAREALGQVAPSTSLNQVVRSGRRIRFLRLDLGAMKEVAHGHEAKVNDVVLALWSGGLRQLMLNRKEPTSGIELITDIPISLRSTGEAPTIDNEVGFMALPLPVWEPDVRSRLDLILRTTRKAKSEQQPAAMARFLAAASAIPFGTYLVAHQQNVNVRVSNVVGPPVPMYVLGARILEILPITRLFGNVGLTLCAFSYAGQMSLVVTADAAAFPDLDVLMAGMEQDWHALIGAHRVELIEGGEAAVEARAATR